MDFSDLINKGQLKKEKTSKAGITNFLQFAEDEISAAKFLETKEEVRKSIARAEALVKRIEEFVSIELRQKSLF